MKERDPVIHVRIPCEVREALRQAAVSEERSMNTLVVRYIRRGVVGDGIPIKRAKGNAQGARTPRASV